MHYYTTKNAANKAIDLMIRQFVAGAQASNGARMNVAALVLEVTAKYAVSELAVKKRVQYHTLADDSHKLQIEGDYLVYS